MGNEEVSDPAEDSREESLCAKKEVSAKKNDSKAEEEQKEKRPYRIAFFPIRLFQKIFIKHPNAVMAVGTCGLVIITGIYTHHTWYQVGLTREMLEVTRDALRLDQRPWLGYYGYEIQARENPIARWESREPRIGEEFRIRCFIENTGKTPALNIFMMPIDVELISIGGSAESPDWSGGQPGRGVLFPNVKGFSHDGEGVFLTDREFLEYSTLKKEMFFWAGLSYKDFAGELYWMSVGVSHTFGTDSYRIQSSFVVPVSAIARSGEGED